MDDQGQAVEASLFSKLQLKGRSAFSAITHHPGDQAKFVGAMERAVRGGSDLCISGDLALGVLATRLEISRSLSSTLSHNGR